MCLWHNDTAVLAVGPVAHSRKNIADQRVLTHGARRTRKVPLVMNLTEPCRICQASRHIILGADDLVNMRGRTHKDNTAAGEQTPVPSRTTLDKLHILVLADAQQVIAVSSES